MQKDEAPVAFLNHIYTGFGFTPETFFKVIYTYQTVFIIMLSGFIVHWLPQKVKGIWESAFTKMPMYLQAVSVAIIVLLIYQAVSDESRGFVYFLY
jgi:alginate O-acetyltransferase complex protein AlgI